MEVVHADGAAVDRVEARLLEERDRVAEVRATVAVQPWEDACQVGPGWSEVDHEHVSARLEDAAYFSREFGTRRAREMMQHDRAQDRVEPRVRKGKGLGECLLKIDGHASALRLLRCSRDHLR